MDNKTYWQSTFRSDDKPSKAYAGRFWDENEKAPAENTDQGSGEGGDSGSSTPATPTTPTDGDTEDIDDII